LSKVNGANTDTLSVDYISKEVLTNWTYPYTSFSRDISKSAEISKTGIHAKVVVIFSIGLLIVENGTFSNTAGCTVISVCISRLFSLYVMFGVLGQTTTHLLVESSAKVLIIPRGQW